MTGMTDRTSDPTALPTLPAAGGPADSGDLGSGLRLRERIVRVLAEAGLGVTVDQDGDVAVDAGDQTVFISVIGTLPPFLRVFGSWLIDVSSDDELALLRAANVVTGAINLVKVTVHGEALVVAADLLLPLGGDELPDDVLAALVSSGIDAILGAAQTWHATLRELLPDTP